jgi:hypothetical protein
LVGLSTSLCFCKKSKVDQEVKRHECFLLESNFYYHTHPKVPLLLLSLAFEVGDFRKVTRLPLIMKKIVQFFSLLLGAATPLALSARLPLTRATSRVSGGATMPTLRCLPPYHPHCA